MADDALMTNMNKNDSNMNNMNSDSTSASATMGEKKRTVMNKIDMNALRKLFMQ